MSTLNFSSRKVENKKYVNLRCPEKTLRIKFEGFRWPGKTAVAFSALLDICLMLHGTFPSQSFVRYRPKLMFPSTSKSPKVDKKYFAKCLYFMDSHAMFGVDGNLSGTSLDRNQTTTTSQL